MDMAQSRFLFNLSRQESEIVAMMRAKVPDKMMATMLGITPGRLESLKQSVKRKMHIAKRYNNEQTTQA